MCLTRDNLRHAHGRSERTGRLTGRQPRWRRQALALGPQPAAPSLGLRAGRQPGWRRQALGLSPLARSATGLVDQTDQMGAGIFRGDSERPLIGARLLAGPPAKTGICAPRPYPFWAARPLPLSRAPPFSPKREMPPRSVACVTARHDKQQYRVGRDGTGRDRIGRDMSGHDRTDQDKSGNIRTRLDRPGEETKGEQKRQDRTGSDRTGQESRGVVSKGHGKA
eukprot:gene1222-biopygen6487